MNIIFICTNYGSSRDGIGMYTKKISDELVKDSNLKIKIVNANTILANGKRELFSFKLMKSMNNFIRENKNLKNEATKFIIEYPFVDWNPLTIYYLWRLKKKMPNSKIILSIHEYFRVNLLRKKIIDILIKISNSYIVTDPILFAKLDKKKVLRNIPSNIQKVKTIENEFRKKENYCYFGLINKSKAFIEMIEAWKIFNKNKEYKLNIYTSSEINFSKEELSFYNIEIFKNLTEEILSLELQKNKFMILPIIPKVDEINGTLKAAALHECIPIGILSENISNLGINILGPNYDKNNLKTALEQSLLITEEKKQEILEKIKMYSEMNSLENTVECYRKIVKL